MDALRAYAEKLHESKDIIGLMAVQRHCVPKMEFLRGPQLWQEYPGKVIISKPYKGA